MNEAEKAYALMRELRQTADDIDAGEALALLSEEIENGLARRGVLPMSPALRFSSLASLPCGKCVSIDVGGTTLKSAVVRSDGAGKTVLTSVRQQQVPGLDRPLSEEAFFEEIARLCGINADTRTVCVSFSHYMQPLPGLDAKILSWSKELKLPAPSGRTVAELLREASRNPDLRVLTVNDAVAATLGCCTDEAEEGSLLGLIMGTGFNICWRDDSGILYNTEAGDSMAFRPGTVDGRIDAVSARPGTALAEKLSSGAYLGQIIRSCLEEAADRGLIPVDERILNLSLEQYGSLLSDAHASEFAKGIVREAERRSVRIAAVCAAAFLRKNSSAANVLIAAEGSVIHRMDGYLYLFKKELAALLSGSSRIRILRTDHAGIKGAARLMSLPTTSVFHG